MRVLDRHFASEEIRAHGGKIPDERFVSSVVETEPRLLEQPSRFDLSAMIILEFVLDLGSLASDFKKAIGPRWVFIFPDGWLCEVEN